MSSSLRRLKLVFLFFWQIDPHPALVQKGERRTPTPGLHACPKTAHAPLAEKAVFASLLLFSNPSPTPPPREGRRSESRRQTVRNQIIGVPLHSREILKKARLNLSALGDKPVDVTKTAFTHRTFQPKREVLPPLRACTPAQKLRMPCLPKKRYSLRSCYFSIPHPRAPPEGDGALLFSSEKKKESKKKLRGDYRPPRPPQSSDSELAAYNG